MHVLQGFCQRRKSSKSSRPRDLHIRKVSFSGSSLSSGCSLSSSSTISAESTPTPTGTPRPDVDPLALHSAFQAPPRLFERPFIRTDDFAPPAYGGSDDADIEEEAYLEHDLASQQPTEMALPPHVSPMDAADAEGKEPNDYFFATLSQRPPLPKSRWSESTIQTMDQFDDDKDSDEVTQSEDSDDDLDDNASVLEMRRRSNRASALQNLSVNVSYTRSGPPRRPAPPQRPPMRSLDTVDNFIRRGGWKRRGIVFHQEDMDSARPENRASY